MVVMDQNADPDDVLLALKCAAEPLSISEWLDLDLRLGLDGLIRDDNGLMNNLSDRGDYHGANVQWVIEQILERDPTNAEKLEKHLELEPWLKEFEPDLYSKLYGVYKFVNNGGNDTLNVLDTNELSKHMGRIKGSIESNDLSQSIGSSKDLLETVLKTILVYYGQTEFDPRITTLFKQVREKLGTSPDGNEKMDELSLQVIGSLANIVHKIAEMRNRQGTGHGRVETAPIDKNSAYLVANSVQTVSIYLINLWKSKT